MATGLIVFLISWPMCKGMVPQNKLYGARYTLSYKSDEHWYAINSYTGNLMRYWSLAIFFSGLIPLLSPGLFSEYVLFVYAMFPVCLLIPAFQGWRFAKRFDAEWKQEKTPPT